MYSKLLVPVDGSATADAGLHEAITLAKALGARLALLHVLEDFSIMVELSAVSGFAETRQLLKEAAQGILAKGKARAAEAGVDAETQLVEQTTRRAADVIVEEARRQGCGLIVMGTHGRRGFNRLIMGSDAELVLREAPVPILLVRLPG